MNKNIVGSLAAVPAKACDKPIDYILAKMLDIAKRMRQYQAFLLLIFQGSDIMN